MNDHKPDPDLIVQLENTDFYIELGIHISYYRRKIGLTQRELAYRSGISRSYLSHIESPNVLQKFSMDTFFNVCRALNTKPENLFIPLP